MPGLLASPFFPLSFLDLWVKIRERPVPKGDSPMKTKQLYLYWLYLFIFCAAMGFIQDRSPLVTALLALLSIAFFIPGALLLYGGIRSGDRKPLRNVVVISASSLGLTMLLFIANTLSVLAPDNDLLGRILQAFLVVFSSPMMCAPYQFISMFLWACLMFTAITYWKKTK